MPARPRPLHAVVVALAAALVPAVPAPSSAPATAAGITVIAHRCNGATDIYTEQTQTACVKAVAAGATTIDGDLRWTSTNTPVMLHDPDLGVFGAPTVQINAVSYTAARQYVSAEGQVLSTLTQLRDLALATGVDLSIEPKTTMTTAQWDKTDTALAPVKDRVLLNSFTPATLTQAAARGYTRLALNANVDVAPAAVPAGVGIVIQKASTIDAATVAALTAAGIQTWCFECDTPTSWTALTAMGVTGFATDDHDAAEVWLAANS